MAARVLGFWQHLLGCIKWLLVVSRVLVGFWSVEGFVVVY